MTDIYLTISIRRYSCQILMQLAFPRQIFEKLLHYQIWRKSVRREPSCSMRKDRRKDVTKLTVDFSQFFANAPKHTFSLLQICPRTISERPQKKCDLIYPVFSNLNASAQQ